MKSKSFSPNEIKSYRVIKKEDIKASNEEILEEWKCKICDSLVLDPKICTVCKHAFCNECIKKFLESVKININVYINVKMQIYVN